MKRYKLYGFTKVSGFPCVCYGKRGFFFALRWVSKLRRFRVYKGRITADETINNGGKMFVGIIVKKL